MTFKRDGDFGTGGEDDLGTADGDLSDTGPGEGQGVVQPGLRVCVAGVSGWTGGEVTRAVWRHFKTDFLWFHRPLSDYWKAFAAAGFTVVGFEEPRVTEDRYHLAENEKKLRTSKTRPYSVAFKLRKTPSNQA